jgi:2'-5' RNA ligase
MPDESEDRLTAARHRLFVAIDAGPELAAAVGQAAVRVRPIAEGASWAGTGATHVTLLFLGNVEGDRVPSLGDALRETARRHPALSLRVRGAGVFGRPTHPSALWAGVEGDREPLAALVADLQRALIPLGFEPEGRAFQPHLTLARARGARGDAGLARCVSALQDHDFGTIQAREITLYRSELHPSGARHHVVQKFPLGALK